jgi:septum formation protein
MRLILASASPARQAVLRNAGLAFETIAAGIDERAAEKPLIETGAPPDDIAMTLAMAKALAVSEAHSDALVIGADQVLALGDERFVKPPDMEAARRQLLQLAGKTHTLHSATACARAGEVLWQHAETAHLTMRALTPAEIGRYLAEAGEKALQSVGAYQLEGIGIRLFDRIDGDYFAILGLPLLPLLRFLRSEGVAE